MRQTRISTYIDLLFCLVILPLIIMLVPVEKWIIHHTYFTQRGILRPAAMHHAQIPHHAHQAHQRQIGIGMDRQLRDP